MDAVLITQVLMNLLENAVFHAKGMRNLWLTVETDNSHAYFSVKDDGCGVDPERLSHIFNSIPDGRNNADSGRSNMGIGLSVCAAIIHAHGGEVHAENLKDGGMNFGFVLSLEEEHERK